jgi:carbon-monoxide dehydrogenase medium subunit
VKFGVHERPTLGIAVALDMNDGRGAARVQDARIAVGCVGPRPARVVAAEARLRDVTVDQIDDVVGAVGDAAATGVDPADDMHGSADYKREMVAVFVRRALRVAVARARGAEPAIRFPYAVVA